jgi:hypothetical protein
MPSKRKALAIAVCAVLLLGGIGSASMEGHSSPHARAWLYAFQGLTLLGIISSLLLHRFYPDNRPAPNPVIGLFPQSQQPQKENKQ